MTEIELCEVLHCYYQVVAGLNFKIRFKSTIGIIEYEVYVVNFPKYKSKEVTAVTLLKKHDEPIECPKPEEEAE